MKNENVWPVEEEKKYGKMRQIFGEDKYLVHGGEENEKRTRRKISGEGKYLDCRGEKGRR